MLTRRAIGMTVSLIAVLACLCTLPARAAQSGDLPKEEWLAISTPNHRIGYQHTKVEATKLNGQPAYRITKEFKLLIPREMTRSAADMKMEAEAITYLKGDFSPVEDTRRMSIKGTVGEEAMDHKVTCKARLEPGKITYEVNRDGEKSKGNEWGDAGRDLSQQYLYQLGRKKLTEGQEVEFFFLPFYDIHGNKINVSYGKSPEKKRLKALKRETIEIGGARYDTLLVEALSSEGHWKMWLLDDGRMVKAEIAGTPFVFSVESKERCLSGR